MNSAIKQLLRYPLVGWRTRCALVDCNAPHRLTTHPSTGPGRGTRATAALHLLTLLRVRTVVFCVYWCCCCCCWQCVHRLRCACAISITVYTRTHARTDKRSRRNARVRVDKTQTKDSDTPKSAGAGEFRLGTGARSSSLVIGLRRRCGMEPGWLDIRVMRLASAPGCRGLNM